MALRFQRLPDEPCPVLTLQNRVGYAVRAFATSHSDTRRQDERGVSWRLVTNAVVLPVAHTAEAVLRLRVGLEPGSALVVTSTRYEVPGKGGRPADLEAGRQAGSCPKVLLSALFLWHARSDLKFGNASGLHDRSFSWRREVLRTSSNRFVPVSPNTSPSHREHSWRRSGSLSSCSLPSAARRLSGDPQKRSWCGRRPPLEVFLAPKVSPSQVQNQQTRRHVQSDRRRCKGVHEMSHNPVELAAVGRWNRSDRYRHQG